MGSIGSTDNSGREAVRSRNEGNLLGSRGLEPRWRNSNLVSCIHWCHRYVVGCTDIGCLEMRGSGFPCPLVVDTANQPIYRYSRIISIPSLIPPLSLCPQPVDSPHPHFHCGGTDFTNPFQHLWSWPAWMDGMDPAVLTEITELLCVSFLSFILSAPRFNGPL